MGLDQLKKHRRNMGIAYICMFLALFTVLMSVLAYLFARKVVYVDNAEVWLHAQALWVLRNVVLFMFLAAFAALWFIPLFFFQWDSMMWVKACTVIGVTFSAIAWLFLLNAWLKGFAKFIQNKAVF